LATQPGRLDGTPYPFASPVRSPKMTMSPEAGSCGFVETWQAVAAYSDAHFDDLDQQAMQI
jgi:hypothetical protein